MLAKKARSPFALPSSLMWRRISVKTGRRSDMNRVEYRTGLRGPTDCCPGSHLLASSDSARISLKLFKPLLISTVSAAVMLLFGGITEVSGDPLAMAFLSHKAKTNRVIE